MTYLPGLDKAVDGPAHIYGEHKGNKSDVTCWPSWGRLAGCECIDAALMNIEW